MQRTQINPKGSSSRTILNRYVRQGNALYRVVKEGNEYSFEHVDEGEYHITPLFVGGWEFAQVTPSDKSFPCHIYDPVSGFLIMRSDLDEESTKARLRNTIKAAGHITGWRALIDREVNRFGCSPSWLIIKPSFTPQTFPN